MGIYLNQRNYFTSGASGSFTNVNRIFPGVAATDGGSGPQILAYNIWNQIWGNMSNVDVGIDLRTPSPNIYYHFLTNHKQTPPAQTEKPHFGATPTSASRTSSASPNSSSLIP